MIVSKVHNSMGSVVLAACDADLVGRTLLFRTGAEIFVNPSFYNERETTADELVELLKSATTANLLGKETVGVALKSGFCSKAGIIDIDGVPHSQMFKI
jgi:hypothetical protein